jgi:AsmA protein
MKILVKTLLWGFGLLLAAMIALAVFLPFYFDPNDYKEVFAKKVKEQYGRDLALNGDVSLSVFPWLGLEIEDATLSNAQGFGAEPFAAVKSAGVRVELLPLLRKEIKVGTVVLDGAVLRLQKNAIGQNNWDDMIEHKKKADEQDKDKDDDGPDDFKVESIEIAALEIKNSSVLWSDAQKGSRYELNKFNFSTGRLRSAEPFLLASDFSVVAGKPAVTSQVSLEGKVKADLEKKTYHIEDFELKAEVAGDKMPGGKQPIRLTGVMDLDLNNQQLVIADLVIEAFTLKLVGAATGRQILDAPVFSGKIKADGMNPRAVMKAMGKDEPKTTDSGVLTKASFDAAFEASTERVNLQPIQIKLDDSSLDGSLSVANFSKPAIGFDLKVDQLDVDRYLSPAETSSPGAGTGDGAGDGKQAEGEMSVDAIRDLNLNGSLAVGKLKVKNLHFSNARLTLRAQNGVMVIEPLTAGFYQGQINLSGRVDATGSRPAYGLKAQTSGIKVEPMLTDLTGKAKINGTGNLDLNVTTAGGTSSELKRGLNGTLGFKLLDGEIKGFNLGQKLRKAQALRKGESLADNEPQTTDFAAITGTLNIVNGVLRNNDLDAKSPAFRVNGDGSASLVSETIDYLAQVAVVNTSKGQGGEQLGELKDLTIPVRLSGSLYDPEWKIDLGSVVKEKVQQKLDEEKDKAKQKLLDKLGIGGSSKQQAAPTTPDAPVTDGTAPAEDTGAQAQPEPEKKSSKDALKEEALRRLLGGSKDGE